jgi:hypothetical protein
MSPDSAKYLQWEKLLPVGIHWCVCGWGSINIC